MNAECVVRQQGGHAGDADMLIGILNRAALNPTSQLGQMIKESGLRLTPIDQSGNDNPINRGRIPPPPPPDTLKDPPQDKGAVPDFDGA